MRSVLHEGIRGLRGNTAVVLSVPRHFDVAILSPGLAPAVLHQVEVLAVFSSVTNSQHTMIQSSGRASSFEVDSVVVELETEVRSINGHGNGTNCGNGLGQSFFISLVDIHVTSDSSTDILGVESAFSVTGFVRIRRLSVNSTIILNVVEGVVHETAPAAVVAVFAGAIDQLLLRKAHQGSSLFRVLTFERASGGESPARSALLLVFDGRHQVFVSPINRCRHGDEVALHEGGGSGGVSLGNDAGSEDELEELFAAQIRVFIHGQSVSVFANGSLQIVQGHALQVLLPNETTKTIFGSRVFFAMEGLESVPLRVEIRVKRKGRAEGNHRQQNHRFQHHFDFCFVVMTMELQSKIQ